MTLRFVAVLERKVLKRGQTRVFGGVAKHTAVPVAPKQTSKMTVDTMAEQNAWYPHSGVNGTNVIMKVSGSLEEPLGGDLCFFISRCGSVAS